MANRHREALEIQEGACNVRAIARALVKAADEAGNEGGPNPREDAAVRLIAHQIAFLCNVREIDDGFLVYSKLEDECRKANEERRVRERFGLIVADMCRGADGD